MADARASVITKLLYVLSDRHPRAEDVVQVNVLGTCGKHGPIKTLARLGRSEVHGQVKF